MEVRPVLFVLLLVSSVSGYNIKINPIVKTSATNLKNTGELEKTNHFTASRLLSQDLGIFFGSLPHKNFTGTLYFKTFSRSEFIFVLPFNLEMDIQ